MGVVKGLGSINKHLADEEAKFNKKDTGDSEKARWFKIGDGQKFKVLFLQELDPDSPNYSAKNDLGFLAIEHSNPANFRKKAVCTIGDGACWACEEHNKDWKAGWKQKTRLYINVLVDEQNGEDPYVAILSQGNGPKSITPALIEYATDEGSITDKWFTITRKGAGQTDTSYLLMPKGAHEEDVESFDLYDLEGVLWQVPYEQQAAHYLDEGQAAQTAAKPETAKVAAGAGAGSTSVDADW